MKPVSIPYFTITCILILLFSCSIQKPLDFDKGSSIYENGYVDQPYVVILQEGSWLCTFTTSAKIEGSSGQHIVSMTSRDKGKSWINPIEIESPTGPTASWAMPYITPYGRVYVFYSFNGGNVKTLNGNSIRNDMLGWYCYKFSDDNGLTWSDRYRIPMRKTNADLKNDWNGDVQIFWGIGKPIDHGNYMTLGFTKLGKYMLDLGEGWFFQSDNIQTERNPDNINWVLLPDGMDGVRHPAYGSVQEEFNLVSITEDTLYSVYRTDLGFIAESSSYNRGKSWTLPDSAHYLSGNPLLNPRACPRIWKIDDNKYLIWYHNHGGTGFADRNPGWIAGGRWIDGEMKWSQPIPIIYRQDKSYERGRLSYPDLVKQDGKFWITVTNKEQGIVIKLPKRKIYRQAFKSF